LSQQTAIMFWGYISWGSVRTGAERAQPFIEERRDRASTATQKQTFSSTVQISHTHVSTDFNKTLFLQQQFQSSQSRKLQQQFQSSQSRKELRENPPETAQPYIAERRYRAAQQLRSKPSQALYNSRILALLFYNIYFLQLQFHNTLDIDLSWRKTQLGVATDGAYWPERRTTLRLINHFSPHTTEFQESITDGTNP